MSEPALRLLSYMIPGFSQSLFERISDVVGAELSWDETRSGPAPGHDPFRDGEADLGWICSTSFVDLNSRGTDPSVRLVGVAWVPVDEDVHGRPVYFGDLVVRSDSKVVSVADLSGQSVGINDEVSLSGHYALRFALRDLGHDAETFANLQYTGGHNASLDAVVAGDVDAAVIDSVVRSTRARNEPEVAALRVAQRLGPWPVQPLVASTRLNNGVIDEVRDALLASNDDPNMRRELADASLARFVRVDEDHYGPIRRAMEGR